MFQKLSKLYPILSVVLIIFSIVGAVLLVRQNQNPQRSATNICNSQGQSCSDTYSTTCNGSGTQVCHKSGTCDGPGDGTHCSWGAGSYCDACVMPPAGTSAPAATAAPGACPDLKGRPDYECNGKSNCQCKSTCYWMSGSSCNQGCNSQECDNGSVNGQTCKITCNVSGGPASCGSSTSPGGKNDPSGCATVTNIPTGVPYYIKYECGNSCPTYEGVVNGRVVYACYTEVRRGTTPESIGGMTVNGCGQIDKIFPDGSKEYPVNTCLEQRCYGSTPVPTKPASTSTPKPSNTSTPTPKNTNTPTPSAAPNACGYHPCDASNPCNAGLTCVLASTGISFCTMPLYSTACVANPSSATCCNPPAPTNTPGPSATPTPGPTSTPGPGPTSTPGPNPTVTSSPVAGNPTRIVLPAAGFDFPVKGLTVVGAIISLLGLLVLL